ncbi:hypothetical protein [Actinomadura sp. DC4]|uniref:hypothetical protein n=1 Tax=Actinomadura sp. DC4 TaxID=3055069 RepID=UPI0025AFCE89|nr:hypothetical protein [Actinomadura sp. DC4]MDN3358422.1 hypothetical protein [Actinomadura sp. DC4]
MAGQESLRAAGARDKDFVGVDIDAMARLIHQMGGASGAISAWLRTNGALPPSVPRTGLRQAAAVHTWVGGQSGMLTRRRNYAITHLSKGGHDMPRVSAGGLGRQHRTTRAGAGHSVGNFADVHAATKAGAADAAAIGKGKSDIWQRLTENADDPDYAHGLYDRLGPAGTAHLIKAALGDKDHLRAVETSLGVASHHLPMNEKWLRAMLDEAFRDGVRDDAVRVLDHAGLGQRAKIALGHLGLTAIRHPDDAMIKPAAEDPQAAVLLYSRYPDAVHRALDASPDSDTLALLVGHATTAHDADPGTVRANAERLAAHRPTSTRA